MNTSDSLGLIAVGLLIAGFVLTVLGLLAWRRGHYPRRVGDTPHCPRCDYILTGINAARCPECGADVSGGRVVRGERLRRPGLAWVGRFTLLLGVVAVGVVLSGGVRRVDWYQHRPTAWVLSDYVGNAASGGNSGFAMRALQELQRRASLSGLSASQVDAWQRAMLGKLDDADRVLAALAWKELQSQAATGGLTAANHDAWIRGQVRALESANGSDAGQAWGELRRLGSAGELSSADDEALVARAIASQSAPFTSLGSSMMDWLGQRCVNHALTADQEKRFLQSMMRLEVKARPVVGPKDRIPYLVLKRGRGPQGWWEKIELGPLFVDDRKVSDGGGSGSGSIGDGALGSSIDAQPVGRHRLRVRLKAGVDSKRHDSAKDGGTLLAEWTPELTADFEVVADAPPIKLTHEPDAATLARCFRAEQFERYENQYRKFDGQVYYSNLPVNVAFAVFARAGGRELRMGSLTQPAGTGTGGDGMFLEKLPPGFALTSIDVILRTDESAARGTVDLTEIWQGEIVIPNVPVKQPGK